MGMTITEKILARASGKRNVSPGDVVFANVDKVMMHDVGGPGVWAVFQDLKPIIGEVEKIWDPDKVWLTEDHFVPPIDKQSAENIKILEDFAKKYGIRKYFKYGLGQYGVCHTLSYEEALVLPGEVYVGTDSHTNTAGVVGAFAAGLGHTDIAYVLVHGKTWFRVPETLLFRVEGELQPYSTAKDLSLAIIREIGTDGANYKAMQFSGSAIKAMDVDERATLTNMSTEAGAKNAIIEPDERLLQYLRSRTSSQLKPVYGDEDAEFFEVYDIDARTIEPLVAKPYSPGNVSSARELSDVEVNRVYIGSCTGGKITDLRMAASILKGRKVKVRTEIVPATQKTYMQALREGLIEIFLQSGALVGAPTCGLCFGGHMGVLRKDEVCISTTNRNFPGRMGDRESKTYLASPLTAAATAVTGKITDPRDLGG
ncbi:MAG: 3-isopropylmalate dehydratase large subunit [Thaumarchaeota archaeon]|nr:3-isopropylmalate dehydratase large subunit [Candidatus Terraquivivens yellowstonensis]MCL7387617.1 3-isopropylmalate dehydratase large subunit [Candidatus Terraquivivens yellowstonensis]MCL7392808.1 3-isopropylmalate dehydratase large subunit [Candidatus Terraquivivens yellowstonensis]MCL7395455.1 3-isopropylmalate dehydratase large subunit [Candidatus Terraquivivens yellowstonensis]MCL7398559.1 3-isopropylmalate dehydratase large subunit [Candidatus Terraquivivens yellowstonensis]